MKQITGVFKQCMEELKGDYDQHVKQIAGINQKIQENNTQVNNAFANQAQDLENKRIDVDNERQKLKLETKKLAILKDKERDLKRQQDYLETMKAE